MASEQSKTKPHVLFIISDDLGYADLGCKSYGQIDSPNIDLLISSGRRLEDYYVLPTCSPTRAAFSTGIYPARYGINRFLQHTNPIAPPEHLPFVADVLRGGGYRTHALGKWHMGHATEWMTPTYRGFETFYGYLTGSDDYFQHVSMGIYDFRFDKRPKCDRDCGEVLRKAKGIYSTYLLANRTVQIIEEHDAKEPLFVYLAWESVHSPNMAPVRYVKPYKGRIKNHMRQSFAGMVTAMDDGVGQILDALRAKDMLEDSIIVFTTDNGAPIGKSDWVGGSNFPLRGSKCSIWEGGVRGVGAMWTGARVRASSEAEVGVVAPTYTPYSGLMHAVDWMPTLCEAAGLRCPDGIDGVSQWSSLMAGAAPPREEVFLGYNTEYQTGAAIRVGDWKLIQGDPGKNGIWFPLVQDDPPTWPAHSNSVPTTPLPPNKPTMKEKFRVFNLAADMTERAELDVPEELLQHLKARLHSYTDTFPQSFCCGRAQNCSGKARRDELPVDPVLNLSYWAPYCPARGELIFE